MGRITVCAKVVNLEDVFCALEGRIPTDRIRTIKVEDAVVDVGIFGVVLQPQIVSALGLRPIHTTHGGLQKYDAVKLTIQGRDCSLDAFEGLDDSRVLIGQIALGALDWVIDSKNQKLIGNPEHGGEHIIEAY